MCCGCLRIYQQPAGFEHSGKRVCGHLKSEFYQPIAADEVAWAIEPMLRFLDELNAGEDAAPIAIGFCYNKIMFDQPNKLRKLKGMFGSADEPVKAREYNAEAAVKSFKAYVYALRNQVVELAPVGWGLKDTLKGERCFYKTSKSKAQSARFSVDTDMLTSRGYYQLTCFILVT